MDEVCELQIDSGTLQTKVQRLKNNQTSLHKMMAKAQADVIRIDLQVSEVRVCFGKTNAILAAFNKKLQKSRHKLNIDRQKAIVRQEEWRKLEKEERELWQMQKALNEKKYALQLKKQRLSRQERARATVVKDVVTEFLDLTVLQEQLTNCFKGAKPSSAPEADDQKDGNPGAGGAAADA